MHRAWLIALLALPLLAMEEGDLKEPDATKTFIIHYAVELPANLAPAATTDPQSQVGLFVCFHGHGGNARGEAEAFLAKAKRLGIEQQYVILGAKSAGAGWEVKDDAVPVTKLIAWAKQQWPINPRRVYTYGMSSGGAFSGSYAAGHPETIAAAIVYGNGFWHRPAITDPKTFPPFYLMMGKDDDDAHKSSSRDTFTACTALGYRLIYREVEGLGHSEDCPPINDDSIRWATMLRHEGIAPSKAELALLRPISRPAKDQHPDAMAIDHLVLVGGAPGGGVIVPLVAGKDAVVRALALNGFQRSLFIPEATTALARAVKDSDPALREQAFIGLGIAANYRVAIAQETLIHVATARGWKSDDRLRAVQALAVAVRFQVRGVYQDLPMFLALIQALDDEDLAIREAAFAALQPIQQSSYDARAERAGRQSGIAIWRQWHADLVKRNGAF